MKKYSDFIAENKEKEQKQSLLSTLKDLFVNGFNIRASIHAASQAFERAKHMTKERWKEFFTKVTNKIKEMKLKDGDYLFYSRKAKQGSVLNISNKNINLITTLPRGKSFPKPGTERMMMEEKEYEIIEID